MQFNIPILFLIFNRPDTTEKVFEKIREIKPKYLFVAADGPRKNKTREAELCEITRNVVLEHIDWDCEIKTLLRAENLGCGKAVSQAITWFFDNVEQGIILEDDTLPNNSFFEFCEEMLLKYSKNEKVVSIGGTSFLSLDYKTNESYVFSEYGGIWGWASWRRAWKGYDLKMSQWHNKLNEMKLQNKFPENQYLFLKDVFDKSLSIDTWDYQWWFHRLMQDGLDITPTKNLIKNIGFNADATHTQTASNEIMTMKLEDINFPLTHPVFIERNNEYDLLLATKYYTKNKTEKISIWKKFWNQIAKK